MNRPVLCHSCQLIAWCDQNPATRQDLVGVLMAWEEVLGTMQGKAGVRYDGRLEMRDMKANVHCEKFVDAVDKKR